VVESQETASDPTTAVTTFQEFANRKVPVVTLGALSTIAQPLDPIATSTQTVLIGNVTVGTPA